MSTAKNEIGPTGIGLKMLTAIAQDGVTGTTLLAKEFGLTKGRISQIATELIQVRLLRKNGAKYALTKRGEALVAAKPETAPHATQKFSPKTDSPIASGSAPTKDSQASKPQAEFHEQNLKNSEFSNPVELVKSKIGIPSFCIETGVRPKRKIEEEPLFTSTDDWRDFLDLATLPRKAGCSPQDLARVIYKEAADNACDAGINVSAAPWIDPKGNIGWAIRGDGPGLDPEQVPIVYSPNRPQLSSKRIRRIQRGILGNGCRVIGGAVAATGGSLMVDTCGRRLTLQMDMAKGQMLVASDEQIPPEPELTLYIALGPTLALRESDFDLAKETIRISRQAARLYSGPSSPWWHGPHNLYRLAQEAQGNISFSQLCRKCGFRISGITQPSWRRPAKEFSFAEIEEALLSLRSRNKPVPPKQLGLLGPNLFASSAYAKVNGIAKLDGAEPPYVLEAWAKCARPRQKASGELKIELWVNGSKTPAKLYGSSTPQELSVHGCDLHHCAPDPPKTGDYTVILSVITPCLPLTNEGKEPSLKHIVSPVLNVVYKASKKAHGALERPERIQIKDAAWQIMEEAYMSASDNGRLPANARQIMYAARPYILKTTGLESFGDQYFTQSLLPDYLDAHPRQTQNWDVVFDARGNGTEPHTGRRIPLGTLAVRRYLEQIRDGALLEEIIDLPQFGLFPTIGPGNRFKNALFIEKEGFDQLLAATSIAQKYDLFITSTKGLRVIALDMLFDALHKHGFQRVFVLHDFDISGFSILGTLGKSSRRYRYQNPIEVIDLGLRLDDVRTEGLQTEPVKLDKNPLKQQSKWAAQARTLERHRAIKEEIEFLRTRRSELNMLLGRAFIAFLERKLQEHGVTKVIPDSGTLALQARRYSEWKLTKEVLEEHRDQIKAQAAAMPIPDDLGTKVAALLGEHPEWSWDKAVTELSDGD